MLPSRATEYDPPLYADVPVPRLRATTRHVPSRATRATLVLPESSTVT
jgi:hypothetical protein